MAPIGGLNSGDMFHKPSMGNNQHQETVIAQGVKVEGDFNSQGDVVIDGEVTGTIRTAGALRVGETAVIEANVSAQTAVVAGSVRGNLQVEERLELLESSRIDGDVSARVLSVAAGAQVNGRISMGAAAQE